METKLTAMLPNKEIEHAPNKFSFSKKMVAVSNKIECLSIQKGISMPYLLKLVSCKK